MWAVSLRRYFQLASSINMVAAAAMIVIDVEGRAIVAAAVVAAAVEAEAAEQVEVEVEVGVVDHSHPPPPPHAQTSKSNHSVPMVTTINNRLTPSKLTIPCSPNRTFTLYPSHKHI